MNIRNFYHVFIGWTALYLIGSLTNFAEFTTYSKTVGVPLISLIVGSAIGFAWEWLQSLKNPKNFDKYDIFRTAVGTLLGGLVSLWIPNVTWLLWSSCIISTVLIVNDIIFLYKIFKNK
jgi:hypothetical protein